MQTTIDDPAHIFTLINTFKVHEGQAASVVAPLKEFTEEQKRSMPGVVCAIVHVSLDGTWPYGRSRKNQRGSRTPRPPISSCGVFI